MVATVIVLAALAIVLIVALAAFLIIRIYPARSEIKFEGVLEAVDCVNFTSDTAELVYSFSTPFNYQIRADASLFYRTFICRLPLSADNFSGDYIPRAGHNIRIICRYNLSGELLSYKFEHLPDPRPVVYIPDPFPDPDF